MIKKIIAKLPNLAYLQKFTYAELLIFALKRLVKRVFKEKGKKPDKSKN